MSADPELAVCCDVGRLAPRVQTMVNAALARCTGDLDAIVYETVRSEALQELYFARGTSKASSVLLSWHGYACAVDVISKSRGWDVWPTGVASDGSFIGGDREWYVSVVYAFKVAGFVWGGDWPGFRDWPHFQPANLKVTPSDEARALIASGGLPAVWAACDLT